MALGTGSLAALLALTALLGAGAALGQPAEFALVPVAAGEERVAEANGLVETARYVGHDGRPARAAACSPAAGLLEVALLLDALSFLAVAAAAAAMHARRHPRAARRGGGRQRPRPRRPRLPRARPRAARHARRRHRRAAVLLRLDHRRAVLRHRRPARRRHRLRRCCSRLDARHGRRRRRARPARARRPRSPPPRCSAIAIQGAGLAAAATASVLAAALAGFALGGVAHGVKNVLLRTLIHERVPGRAARPRLRRLQRGPQRRRAGRARRRRRARRARSAPGPRCCSPASFRLRSASPPCSCSPTSPIPEARTCPQTTPDAAVAASAIDDLPQIWDGFAKLVARRPRDPRLRGPDHGPAAGLRDARATTSPTPASRSSTSRCAARARW